MAASLRTARDPWIRFSLVNSPSQGLNFSFRSNFARFNQMKEGVCRHFSQSCLEELGLEYWGRISWGFTFLRVNQTLILIDSQVKALENHFPSSNPSTTAIDADLAEP